MRFYASPADEPSKPVDRATVKRVVNTFRPYRGKVGIVGLLIVITSGLGVVNPLLIVFIFNHGLFGVGSPATCQGGPCPDLHVVFWGVALIIVIPIITGVIGIDRRTTPTSSACA